MQYICLYGCFMSATMSTSGYFTPFLATLPPTPSPVGFGRRDVVEHLIQHGAKVDTQDDGECSCHGNSMTPYTPKVTKGSCYTSIFGFSLPIITQV